MLPVCRRVAVLWLLALLLAPLPAIAEVEGGVGVATGRPPTVVYEPPVQGPVSRHFDPPASPYGPGHRGVTLDVRVGTPVGAAAAGTVTFAGSVAGVVWVVVSHRDGIRTSYGPLYRLRVRAGDRVARGDHLGDVATAGVGTSLAVSWAAAFDPGLTEVAPAARGLHWGARRGDEYIDPLSLLHDRPGTPTLIGPGGWEPVDHPAVGYEPWEGGRLRGLFVAGSPEAEHPYRLTAPTPHHLIVIGGYATSSHAPPIDGTDLGYDPRSITHFSYAGRHDGEGDPEDPRRDQLPYGPEHTWEGVEAAAHKLRDQLQAQWAREPGRAVDLVGHSLGGVVATWYLTHLHDPYDPTLPPIANVATIASPLRGTGTARLGWALDDHRVLGTWLYLEVEAVRETEDRLGMVAAYDRFNPKSQTVRDLQRRSPVLKGLRRGWEQAQEEGPAGALATGTRVLNLGASRDVFVSSARTSLDGAHRLTLPRDHMGVLRTEAVRETLHEFFADGELADSPGHVSRVVTGRVDSAAERAGTGLWLSDVLRPLLKPPRTPGPVPQRR